MNSQGYDNQNPEKPKGSKIPYLIVAFFVVIFLVNLVFLYFAQTTHTGVIRDQAYEHGLAYNDVVAAAKKSDELAWGVMITPQADKLAVRLTDAEGAPITTANVVIRFRRPTVSGYDFEQALTPMGDGFYKMPVDWPLPGLWDAIVDVTWQQHQYQTKKRLQIPQAWIAP